MIIPVSARCLVLVMMLVPASASGLSFNVAFAQSSLWSRNHQAGLDARQRGDYRKSEELLRAALEQSSDRPAADQLQSLNSLSVVLTELGRSAEAEPLLRRVLAIQEMSLPGDSLETARTLSNLSECLRQQGKLDEAEKLNRRSLPIVEKHLGSNDLAASVVINNLSMILLDQCRYAEAEELMKRSLDIRETRLGAQDKLVATVLNNLATLNYRQGKYREAESLFRRTLAIWEKTPGRDHPDYALGMSNLALVLRDQGNLEEAERLYRHALSVQEANLGAESTQVATTLSNIATLLAGKGPDNFKEAEEFFRRSVNIWQAALDKGMIEENADLLLTLHNLAELYLDENKLDQAEAVCKQCLALSEKIYGSKDARVATELLLLSRIAAAQGNRSEKDATSKRACDITASLPGYVQQAAMTGDATPGGSGVPEAGSRLSPSRPVKDKWAVVIGISNFKDPSLNLKYSAKDAIDFRNYLVSKGHFRPDHVKLLTDKAATRENIVSTLGERWLTRVANRDDLVVVYISSHGSSAKRDVAGVNMLVAYDTNIDNQLATGIPMEWLSQIIKDQVHCERVVLILDVCHSGAARTASKGLVRRFDFNLNEVGAGSGQIILCSSQSDQVSWESSRYPNSVFTRRLIEGLERNGSATRLSEAFSYLKEHVEEEVLRERAVVQTPVLKRKWSGDDVILSVPPTSPRPGL
ncbi:MAG: tetratricopeptide repeat protein [Candidatus Melainabacteria bacterium]|nr:tetratricopeptide repeat protein [Candidatus Melainabacteria bacterium]